jgi:type I restriction enzyme R subunit
MLDTGIDVPEVVNLVFFKLVRSKTKFWQMVGRGTRLRPDLFGPGQDKQHFYIFDYCGNLEFFSQDPVTTEGAVGESLSTRLFRARLELISELDHKLEVEGTGGRVREPLALYADPRTEAELRHAHAARLHEEVAAMNIENFVVRPRRQLVEHYARAEAWAKLSPPTLLELSEEVADLPSELPAEPEEAKRFDMLTLTLQLALLRAEPGFERLRDQLRTIAGLLEEKQAIPLVQAQMPLIQDLQTDEWWQDATLPMLESVRRRLRDLVRLIEKKKRKPVYTDFVDEMGVESGVALPGTMPAASFERFRNKARAFLRAHQDHVAVHKLRSNHPLTPTDLAELERMLVESGIGSAAHVERAKQESEGLGLFVRSLVGLDREAAKDALSGFLEGKTLTANQIEFLSMVIDHLTERGFVPTKLLYESPFTDLNPHGIDGVFPSEYVDALIDVLETVRSRAVA